MKQKAKGLFLKKLIISLSKNSLLYLLLVNYLKDFHNFLYNQKFHYIHNYYHLLGNKNKHQALKIYPKPFRHSITPHSLLNCLYFLQLLRYYHKQPHFCLHWQIIFEC